MKGACQCAQRWAASRTSFSALARLRSMLSLLELVSLLLESSSELWCRLFFFDLCCVCAASGGEDPRRPLRSATHVSCLCECLRFLSLWSFPIALAGGGQNALPATWQSARPAKARLRTPRTLPPCARRSPPLAAGAASPRQPTRVHGRQLCRCLRLAQHPGWRPPVACEWLQQAKPRRVATASPRPRPLQNCHPHRGLCSRPCRRCRQVCGSLHACLCGEDACARLGQLGPVPADHAN